MTVRELRKIELEADEIVLRVRDEKDGDIECQWVWFCDFCGDPTEDFADRLWYDCLDYEVTEIYTEPGFFEDGRTGVLDTVVMYIDAVANKER